MNDCQRTGITSKHILSARGRKNKVSHERPYGYITEKELTFNGNVEDVSVVFITNRECPYRCLMCDLWKNTTDTSVPPGSVPGQIEYALSRLPKTKHIKLYNSGSFFDSSAIPESDYPAIASLLRDFDTIIVESHPKLINKRCLHFSSLTGGRLQVAMGLETAEETMLKKLNKQMLPGDYRRAVGYLKSNNINTRTFILLRPPFLTEEEGIEEAMKSVDYAFDSGTDCCTVIPVRPGNGIMDKLLAEGLFTPPSIASLEKVTEYGIIKGSGLMFADTWDLEYFSNCPECLQARTERIIKMNLTQSIPPPVICKCGPDHILPA
ncbi:MAG: hypothetical protein MUE32_07695 [Bacteroidales bacterium]|jgi:hypothetical protein|nr:hypothetical protein [Bacteroidales bacterium]